MTRGGPDANVIGADPAVDQRGSEAPRAGEARRPGSSRWARAVASRLAARPGRLLVVADFDGTLAEASRDPGAARIVPLAQRALRRLAGVAAASPERVSVAVLTGRTAADVAARVGVGGIAYLGDHGLQRGTYARGARPSEHRDDVPPTATRPRTNRPSDWRTVFRGSSATLPGCSSSERARPSRSTSARPTTHWRRAPRSRRRSRRPNAACRHTISPTTGAGWSSISGRGRRAGKREAMEALLSELRPATVVAFGDDSSDADAFSVLRAARTSGTCDGLAVGVTGPRGVPDDVRATADVVLDTPHDAARLLSALARVVAERTA